MAEYERLPGTGRRPSNDPADHVSTEAALSALRANLSAALGLGDGNKDEAIVEAARLAVQERNRLQDEVVRLDGWLAIIDGGDGPCTDESRLRQWAYEARTLRRDVPANGGGG